MALHSQGWADRFTSFQQAFQKGGKNNSNSTVEKPAKHCLIQVNKVNMKYETLRWPCAGHMQAMGSEGPLAFCYFLLIPETQPNQDGTPESNQSCGTLPNPWPVFVVF